MATQMLPCATERAGQSPSARRTIVHGPRPDLEHSASKVSSAAADISLGRVGCRQETHPRPHKGSFIMSISGISSSNFFQSLYSQNTQRAQFAQQFQQLGQDLQSGNLSQAQTDFATLTANSPFAQQAVQAAASPTTSNNAAAATTTSPNASPIAQAFTQLSQDLQAGNLT